MYVSVAAGLLGIALAYSSTSYRPRFRNRSRTFRLLYRWVYNKYFVDELYDEVVVSPLVDGSRTLLWRTVDAGGSIDRQRKGGNGAQHRGHSKRLQSVHCYAAWVVLGSLLSHSPASRQVQVTLLTQNFLFAARIPCAAVRAANVSRMGALVISLFIFVISLGLIGTVTSASGGYSFVHNAPWIDYLDPISRRHDGLSLWLVILTTFLTRLRCSCLEKRRPSGEGLLRVSDPAGIRIGRRLRFARPVPVLCVLGSFAGADVLPDRHLGQGGASMPTVKFFLYTWPARC